MCPLSSPCGLSYSHFSDDMDYFNRARKAIAVQMMFEVPDLSEAFNKALSKTPLVMTQLRCADIEVQAFQCQTEKGENHPDCEELLFHSFLCVASAMAPKDFEKWAECAQKNEDDPSKCEALFQKVVEETTIAVERNQPTVSDLPVLRQVANACDKVEDSEKLSCAASVVCEADYNKFAECVNKNGEVYEAAACRAVGIRLATCMGERAALALVSSASLDDLERQKRGGK